MEGKVLGILNGAHKEIAEKSKDQKHATSKLVAEVPR